MNPCGVKMGLKYVCVASLVCVWSTSTIIRLSLLRSIPDHHEKQARDRLVPPLSTSLTLPNTMKFTVAAFVALVAAASTNGFSISMSSYLDNLGSGATLQSFGSTTYAPAPAAPAPSAPAPSYSAPAPAAAPYKSAFADMPANSDLNYMSALGGGNQMKRGKNYTGMNSSFRPTQSTGNAAYLDNLKGAVMSNGYAAPQANGYSNGYSAPQESFAPAPAPAAPYQSSFAPAPAPAYQSSFSSPSSYGGKKSYMPAPTNSGRSGTIGTYLDGL